MTKTTALPEMAAFAAAVRSVTGVVFDDRRALAKAVELIEQHADPVAELVEAYAHVSPEVERAFDGAPLPAAIAFTMRPSLLWATLLRVEHERVTRAARGLV